jgi:hypothetical protein
MRNATLPAAEALDQPRADAASTRHRGLRVPETYSVRDVCERYGVCEGAVLTWIRNGSLRAFSVSRRPGAKKPRWRITQAALDAFEALRTPTPPPPRTRRKAPAGVIEFY